MFCIAAFIIFLILGLFSATHRKLAGQAWYCVRRKIMLKPCDINFKQEMKGKLLGKFIFTHPRIAKFLDKWIDAFAFVFVLLSIWSLFAVALAGLNLWVYDTCSPHDAEGCSLSGEACSVASGREGMFDALIRGRIIDWSVESAMTFGDTVSRIPDRFRNWDPEDYLPQDVSWYGNTAPSTDEIVLEIIDPGCVFCAKQTKIIKDKELWKKYRVTYLAYPIPDSTAESGTKFPHSMMVAQYLEVLKGKQPYSPSPDWELLEKIFFEKDPNGFEWQYVFNNQYNAEETRAQIHVFLAEIGYSAPEIAVLEERAQSTEIAERIAEHKRIVEEEVRTIKIPTVITNGRRFDRVVDLD